jgi:hypothetical protein
MEDEMYDNEVQNQVDRDELAIDNLNEDYMDGDPYGFEQEDTNEYD